MPIISFNSHSLGKDFHLFLIKHINMIRKSKLGTTAPDGSQCSTMDDKDCFFTTRKDLIVLNSLFNSIQSGDDFPDDLTCVVKIENIFDYDSREDEKKGDI